jgi:predicted dehydrogenase
MNIGLVGAGYWGPNLARAFVETGRCDQVGCFDKSQASLAKLSRRFPSIVMASDLDELIERSDGLVVATPVSTLFQIAKRALLAGKSVMVEKPLAMSSMESRELIEIASENEATLMVGHTFIYSPPVRKVKQLITAGEIGRPYFLSSSRVNLGIHQKDVDVLWDLAPHDLSILFYWLDEKPESISAVGRACIGAQPDVASIHLRFPSGFLANIEISWLAPRKLRRTVLVGSKSMVVYDDTSADEKIKLYDKGVNLKNPENFGEYQLSYRTGEVVSPTLDTTEPLLMEANHFIDCMEQDLVPETDGVMGHAVVLALEAASISMRNGGRFIDVPQPGNASTAPEVLRVSA